MSLPLVYDKLVFEKETSNFRDAVQVVTVPLPHPEKNQVLVKITCVGVNASDVVYFGKQIPYDAGCEAVGEVVAVGDGVTKVSEGDNVAFFDMGAYAEYKVVDEGKLIPLPSAKPEFVALVASGLTAAIGLDKQGLIKKGDTVLITAAAGGLGHIAVQWAKAKGCHVIGLCSSRDKEEFLTTIGCDKTINYKKENVAEVIQRDYPNGIDVIWETVGGELYKTLLQNLAVRGRLVIIGFISGYKDEALPTTDIPELPKVLLGKSATVGAFLLHHYQECFSEYLHKLITQTVFGQLKIQLDTGRATPKGEFKGIESIIDAVEHLYSGKSFGKVAVHIA